MAISLTGCGGGDDEAPGGNGTNGTKGTNGKVASTGINVGSNTVAASSATSAARGALSPQVSITSVTFASAPVVKFTVKDAAGNPVLGLASKAQSATATVPGLTNIAFTLAKLVPGTTLSANGKTLNAEPSKWVGYLVTRPPTVAEKTATAAIPHAMRRLVRLGAPPPTQPATSRAPRSTTGMAATSAPFIATSLRPPRLWLA
jgi:hypothetical protein